MKTATHLGWPVVTATNCFNVIRGLGIKPWPETAPPEPIDDYRHRATNLEEEEYQKFGPKIFVARHETPHGASFNGFRTVFRPSALVFALIDGYVPVTAEWKHGNNRITIVPVAGVPGRAEADLSTLEAKMSATAIREWREETGTELESVQLLAPSCGMYAAVRSAELQYFPFLGHVRTPILKGKTKFDDTEHLKMVAFPLHEWIILIETPEFWNSNPDFGLEVYARDLTYAALRKLRKLRLTD